MNCLSGLRLISLLLPALAGTVALAEDQQLVPVARLWTAAKYFHPAIASRPIDWDKALVDALPAIRSAKDDVELKAALQSMLSVLQDPMTAVAGAERSDTTPSGSEAGGTRRAWMHHGLPSALPSAASFYQAFVIHSGTQTDSAFISITPSVRVQIRLSEPVETTSAGASPHPLPNDQYPEAYPSAEVRILSAFRIWGVIHNFYGYRDLMDEDWDAVFAEALPKFIAAADARQYHLAVADMISRLSDSNSTVQSAELDRYFGEAEPAVRTRLLEKKLVVTEILDAAAKTAGLKLGDVVERVDGERIADRIRDQANYLSASTAQALSALVAKRILNGQDGSTATLVVSEADDRARTVKLVRSLPQKNIKAVKADQPVRILAHNIGYADLTRLTAPEVEGMFDKLHNTASIIFDARGPIAPMTSEIASCVTKRNEITTAIVTGPLSLQPDLPSSGVSTSTASYFAMETIRHTCAHPYKDKTVMLIDERTIGAAEHLGLALGPANNTEFLGTPSAGADSSVTAFTAPGGIQIQFSGTDVRFFNGAPIQRMGLQPALALAPKVAAIRTGRDVVLEKAIEYLRPPATQALNNSQRADY